MLPSFDGGDILFHRPADRVLMIAAVNALPRRLDEVERLRAFILAEALGDAWDCWHGDMKRINAEVADTLARAGIKREAKP